MRQNELGLEKALATIAAEKDPVRLAILRERYWDAVNASTDPDVIAEAAALKTSAAIFGSDARGEVTGTDLVGLYAASDLIAKMAGVTPFGSRELAADARTMRARFATLPPGDRANLMHGMSRAVGLARRSTTRPSIAASLETSPRT